jgi:uncharacterized caspase-like protein
MMMSGSLKLCRWALAAAAFLLVSEPAFAEKRVALVLGNSNYRNVAPLANPVNDSARIASTLKDAGFDVVDSRRDLPAAETRRALRDFADRARDADIAVVYYAGHGIEVDGSNYLIPVDAKLERDTDVYDEALSLDRVLLAIEPAKILRLVILDACRDNPFVKTMKRTLASRSFGRGLAGVEPAMSNTLIAFAAKAGSTANDGEGAHSPFTTALLKHLTAPGLDLRIAFGKVRDEVLASTGARQEPHVYGSLGGTTIALVPAGEVSGAATAAPAPGGDVGNGTWRDYEFAMQVGTRAGWDAFLAAHPTGFYADLARAQRAKLLAAPTAAPAVAPVPAVLTPSRPEPETRGRPSASRRVDSPPARAKPKPAKETASGAASRSRSSSSSGCSYVRRAVAAGTAAGLDNGVGLIAFGRRSCGG